MKNLALIEGFNTIQWSFVIVAYFLGHPVYFNTGEICYNI